MDCTRSHYCNDHAVYIKEAETNFFYYNTQTSATYCYLKYNCHLLKSVANLIPLRALCVVKSKAHADPARYTSATNKIFLLKRILFVFSALVY